jgi:hypothetical protein
MAAQDSQPPELAQVWAYLSMKECLTARGRLLSIRYQHVVAHLLLLSDAGIKDSRKD